MTGPETLKWVHVLAVAASGALFAFRGLGVALGRQQSMMAPGYRYTSYAIDTVLLLAGVRLAYSLRLDPLTTDWLGLTPAGRRAAYLAALGVYGWMIGVALRHHPLGWLSNLAG